MNTKLTLRLDKDLIDSAKSYGAAHGKSVSQLVGDYFAALKQPMEERPLSPVVARLKGIAKGAEFNKHDYREYLAKKHLGE